MVFTHDAVLLNDDNSEWAVAHRLAVYLEHVLPGWNVDCEFNRQGMADPKVLEVGSLIRPDIIVHHRGRVEREHNLLVVELKKSYSQSDQAKVQEYTAPPAGERKFQYMHGLTIAMGDDFALTWFENGSVVG